MYFKSRQMERKSLDIKQQEWRLIIKINEWLLVPTNSSGDKWGYKCSILWAPERAESQSINIPAMSGWGWECSQPSDKTSTWWQHCHCLNFPVLPSFIPFKPVSVCGYPFNRILGLFGTKKNLIANCLASSVGVRDVLQCIKFVTVRSQAILLSLISCWFP